MQSNFMSQWNNGFMHQYMQQHAAMNDYIDTMHESIHYGNGRYPFEFYNSGNNYNAVDYSSCCSSCCCCTCSCRRSRCECCSSGRCPKAPSHFRATSSSKVPSSSKNKKHSKRYDPYQEQYQDEQYQEQYQDEQYQEQYRDEEHQDEVFDEEDESDCEYEFNVDAILAMRAAKKEIKKQEMLEAKKKKSSAPNNTESSDSTSDNESKFNSSDLNESVQEEEIEYIDSTKAEMIDKHPLGPLVLGKFNRTEEEQARNYILEQIFGPEGKDKVINLEMKMLMHFQDLYDEHQPSFWPVLPMRSKSY